jgi:putative transposase
MLRATKVRLFPIAEEVEFLNRQFGAVRFVRNKALAIKVHRYRAHGQKLSAKHDLKKLLAVAKKSRRYAWLAGYDSMALQQACIDLDKAFRNFFEGRARLPRFKRKQGEQSSYHCSGKIGFGEDWIQRPMQDMISSTSCRTDWSTTTERSLWRRWPSRPCSRTGGSREQSRMQAGLA